MRRVVVPIFHLALFDDFANTFDEKLGALNYNVPSLIGEAAFWLLQQGERSTYRSVLDAGCGTGLAGRFLKPLVEGTLVGVDLSTKMLEVARECTLVKGCGLKEPTRGDEDSAEEEPSGEEEEPSGEDDRSSIPLYNHLISLDLETATLDEVYSGYIDPPADVKDGFELIVAADVLVYFGDLQKVLTNFANLSAKSNEERDAFLIFSCERIEEEDAPSAGWKLQSSGRYAHSKSYVVKTAKEAGFRLIGYEEIVPRMEKGEEVQGHLFQFAHGLDEGWDEDEVGDMGELVFMDIIDENGQVIREEL
jgi:predicted TPR repeat methyltransferase